MNSNKFISKRPFIIQPVDVQPIDIETNDIQSDDSNPLPINVGNSHQLPFHSIGENSRKLPIQPNSHLTQIPAQIPQLNVIDYTNKQPAINQPMTNNLGPINILELSKAKNIRTPVKTLEQTLIDKGGYDPKFMIMRNVYAQAALQIFPSISNETAATIGELRASKAYYGVTYQPYIENIFQAIDSRYMYN
jgi:hypothetical protein